jgi:hypothetical protein
MIESYRLYSDLLKHYHDIAIQEVEIQQQGNEVESMKSQASILDRQVGENVAEISQKINQLNELREREPSRFFFSYVLLSLFLYAKP